MFYSVVLLDGKELQNLSLQQVQELFFNRRINQDSLVCSTENPRWMMLKRAFNLTDWSPVVQTPPPPAQPGYQPTFNPFHQQQQPPPAYQPVNNQFNAPPPTPPNHYQQQAPPINFQTPPAQQNPVHQPVTFNQFPQNQPPTNNNPYAANASNGYSQNNQTETYYQAETTQTSYNFENKQAAYAPSQYSNSANSYNYQPQNSAQNYQAASAARHGAKHAAVFLIVNACFYVALTILEAVFTTPGENQEKYQMGLGKTIIPFVIDLILAVKLWKQDDVESARKWVLVRSYLGFIIFGVIVPIISFGTGEIFVGIFSLVTMFFYFVSLALVLHGKENPPVARVFAGTGTFAVYFLIMSASLALSLLGGILPSIAPRLDSLKGAQFAKYKVEGKEFEDKTTGAKVVLPEGWTMIALDNPLIHTPEARMIAVDDAGNRLTMLEVVPVPGNLDMKRADSGFILEQISNGVVKSLKQQVQANSGFGQNSFNEVTRLSIYVGKHPAKLLVFDKTENGVKAKGHLIITYDELTFYVLHSWCPAEEYETAQNDFRFFEHNFHVPEKINSTFTQTAEKQKK